MFKWFMAKTLITKIIIVTSSVVVIGGVTAGAIIIPKQIEIKQEEQRQEQIRLENEEDLAKMSIKIKGEYEATGITMPLKGITTGHTIERYDNFEKYLLNIDGYNTNYGNKEELHKELINFFVESYTGGEITVEENIDLYTRGEYPITFTVTSEKENTKSVTVLVKVLNYARVSVNVDKTDITITKGTDVDIMEGVTFDSILPEEEKGHIETEGTVDINTVGTYKITYRYIPKDEHEGVISEGTRTYKVIDNLSIKEGKMYVLRNDNYTGSINLHKDSLNLDSFTCYIEKIGDIEYYYSGEYKQNGENITLTVERTGTGGEEERYNATWHGKVSNNGNSITITDEKSVKWYFSLSN